MKPRESLCCTLKKPRTRFYYVRDPFSRGSRWAPPNPHFHVECLSFHLSFKETFFTANARLPHPVSMTSIASDPSDSPKKSPKTCDNCRKRKARNFYAQGGAVTMTDSLSPPQIRCRFRDKVDSCEGCTKLELDCTFDYVKKKPGRKNSYVSYWSGPLLIAASFALAMRGSSSSSVEHPPRTMRMSQAHLPYTIPAAASPMLTFPFDPTRQTPDHDTQTYDPGPSNRMSSFAHSPSTRLNAMETTGLSWLDNLLDPSASTFDFSLDGALGFASDQAQLLSLESPDMLNNPNGSRRSTMIQSSLDRIKEPQLEDVTSWANISHFISLFLQYLYPLLPLVHRPTFAEHLATRRDTMDGDFRALLLSIGGS